MTRKVAVPAVRVEIGGVDLDAEDVAHGVTELRARQASQHPGRGLERRGIGEQGTRAGRTGR